MSWGTYSITKIKEGQYFWCSWTDWRYQKPPIKQGYASSRKKAEEAARDSSGGVKATCLQDSCAKAKYRILEAAELKKQAELEESKRERERIREKNKAIKKEQQERRRIERERKWKRLATQRERERSKKPRPGKKLPFHAPGQNSVLDKERPFKLPGTPTYEWDRSDKKPFKLT